jgi:hypothetical protein
MTGITNAIETFDVVGNREGLIDAIYKTDTAETPLLSAIKKGKAISTLHEWQTDDYGSAGTNYTKEGAVADAESFVATARLTNYTQILSKTAFVTGTQMSMSHAGVADEMAYQVEMRTMRLKKDIEFALLDNNVKVAGTGNDSAAREMGGLPTYIITNYDANGATAPTSGNGLTAWTGGTAVALTEGRVKAVLADMYDSGGNADMIICTAAQKQTISSFSGNGTRFIMADSNKLQAAYDIYASDFGQIKVAPCRHGETAMTYILDTSMLKWAVLRDFQVNDIASTGDYKGKQILVEGTLEVCNEKAQGLIVNVA